MPPNLPERRYGVFRAKEFVFGNGHILDNLEIAYWTMGRFNAAKDNAVLLCHGGGGDRDWPLDYCRPGGAFDPDRWFLISADMPGGGSSSRLRNDPRFPRSYAISDLSASVAMLLRGLEIPALRAFCGPSMASAIGLDLAFREPDIVGGLVLWVAGYRSDGFAQAVADAMISILRLDGTPQGMRAAVGTFLPAVMGRAMIAAMDRATLSAMLDTAAKDWTALWEPTELIARYSAIRDCNLAALHGGETLLGSGITCPVLWLQSASDNIYPVEDAQALAGCMADAVVEVLETPCGHGAPRAPPASLEFEFFDQKTAAFLAGLQA